MAPTAQADKTVQEPSTGPAPAAAADVAPESGPGVGVLVLVPVLVLLVPVVGSACAGCVAPLGRAVTPGEGAAASGDALGPDWTMPPARGRNVAAEDSVGRVATTSAPSAAADCAGV